MNNTVFIKVPISNESANLLFEQNSGVSIYSFFCCGLFVFKEINTSILQYLLTLISKYIYIVAKDFYFKCSFKLSIHYRLHGFYKNVNQSTGLQN